MLAYEVDVRPGVVLGLGSPTAHDVVDILAGLSGSSPSTYVVSEQPKGCAQSILHTYELTKAFVGLLWAKPLPFGAMPDVQGVVVSDTSWFHASWVIC